MVSKEIAVTTRAGIHARPATRIVELANKFKSNVFIGKDNNVINAKSIMGILTLGAAYKTKVVISVEGPDEEEALDKILALFENRFEE